VKHPTRHLAALLAAALLLSACVDDGQPPATTMPMPLPTPPTTPPTRGRDDAEEGADASTDEASEVTLLTHDSFDVSEDVLASFTADTGIEVTIVPLGDAGTALNQAILTQDAPQGDLLFGVDTSSCPGPSRRSCSRRTRARCSSRSTSASCSTPSCGRSR
jgi:thiamine transport system substrate-binding protein